MSLNCCQFKLFHEALCSCSSALKLEGNNSAAAVWHVLLRKLIVRICLKSRIVDLGNFFSALKELGNRKSVLDVTWHAHMQ